MMKINQSLSNLVGLQYLFLFIRISNLYLFVATGFVLQIVRFLGSDRRPRLQRYAASAVIEIAYSNSEHVKVLVHGGVIPKLVRLIDSKSNFVRNEAIWALSNIVGDNKEFRDIVISHGALDKLSALCSTEFTQHSALPLLRLISWILYNFLQCKPIPDWKHTKIAINMLSSILASEDEQILKDSSYALGSLCDPALGGNTKQHIEAIKSNGSLSRLVSLLNHKTSGIRHYALRVCYNIAKGSDEQTQYIVDLGVLKPLRRMIESDEQTIMHEACYTVSNITGGSRKQIDAVIAANLFPSLIECVRTGTYKIACEASWAIANATSDGSTEQIIYLEKQDVIPSLWEFVRRIPEGKDVVDVIYDAMCNILLNIVKAQNPNLENGVKKNSNMIEDNTAFIAALKRIVPRKKKSECWQCAVSMQEKKRFTCSACQRPTYCGKRCQKRHWSRHRTDCKVQCRILEKLTTTQHLCVQKHQNSIIGTNRDVHRFHF